MKLIYLDLPWYSLQDWLKLNFRSNYYQINVFSLMIWTFINNVVYVPEAHRWPWPYFSILRVESPSQSSAVKNNDNLYPKNRGQCFLPERGFGQISFRQVKFNPYYFWFHITLFPKNYWIYFTKIGQSIGIHYLWFNRNIYTHIKL